jgi:hypothetical protein
MSIDRHKRSEAELEQHPYWVSWYCPNDMMGKFELHSPWWISGETMEDDDGKFAFTLCAAVMATSEDQAKLKVVMSHDAPYIERANAVEWRFADPRPDDWSPFSDRFPKADWMQWPQAAA